jgi:hypothetical protein
VIPSTGISPKIGELSAAAMHEIDKCLKAAMRIQ